MSKIVIEVDTEDKSALVTIDGDEVTGVSNFSYYTYEGSDSYPGSTCLSISVSDKSEGVTVDRYMTWRWDKTKKATEFAEKIEDRSHKALKFIIKK